MLLSNSNRTLCGREQGAQAVERLPLQRWQDVGVGVEGQRDLAVPQYLHHHPRIHALSEEQTCSGVAKVVEPLAR